jgi:formylglycine-generating enzyme required for sulfatase activity/GTPase SAR1 family protein
MSHTKQQSSPVQIIDDTYACEKVNLGFTSHADTLAGLIANKDNRTPLVMGVYGDAGCGKTTLMRAIRSRLDGDGLNNTKQYRRCKTIWFNAWKHDGQQALLASLIETVFKAMDADGFFSLAGTKIEAIARRIDQSNIFASVSKLGAGTDISEFFSDMAYKEKLGAYDTFQKYFSDLVWTFLYWRFKTTQEKKPDDKKVALVIFIDNLDQCTTTHIADVLKTIELYFSRTGWAFIIGASKQRLQAALAKQYGEQTAQHVREKIIPVSFEIPQAGIESFDRILDTAGGGAGLLKQYRSVIVPAFDYNPGKLKRFVNALNLLHGLLGRNGTGLGFETIVRWGVLGFVDPELAADIKNNPYVLEVMQKQIKRLEARHKDQPIGLLTEEQLVEEKVPHRIQTHLRKAHTVQEIKALDITLDQCMAMLSMSRTVALEQYLPARQDVCSPAVLSPYPMVSVSAGPFLYGDGKTAAKIDTAFDIGIYPVTHGQFRTFVEAGGYADQTWWSSQGWRWRKDTQVQSPAFWGDPRWHRDECPVVGVSWFEADAYARWAGLGLPTEQQWERAAAGCDGWDYPWGNTFQAQRCNTWTSTTGVTTPVYRYSNGVSPEGCYDMAGNVWEWTACPDGDGQKTAIAKGGSCFDDAAAARNAGRRELRPELRHPGVGLRCIRQTNPS